MNILKANKIKSILIFSLFIFYSFCSSKFDEETLINFQFNGKSLQSLVQEIANIKGVNILIAPGIDKAEVVVNFNVPEKIPIYEVEEYLLYFLSMSGYMITYHDGVFILMKKTDEMLSRAQLPLYVNIPPEELPDNPGMIRAIYFLKHARVPSDKDPKNAITEILLNFLPEGNKAVIVDPRSNALIITSSANCISAAMSIILEIDKYGVKDEIVFLHLNHVGAESVKSLLEEILNITKDANGAVANTTVYNGPGYFSSQSKFIVDAKSNTLIILGKRAGINKIVDFIKTQIDVPLYAERHFVHIYNLNYLDARVFKDVLQSVVSGNVSTGDQSTGTTAASSVYKAFSKVRIIAEQEIAATTKEEKATKLKLGGNRLLIAATEEDYQQIKILIEKLDKPQPQVVIELFLLDLEADDSGLYSSQTRIPSIFNLPEGVGFQSIMMNNSQTIINSVPSSGSNADIIGPKSTLNANLLSDIPSQDSRGSIADSRNGIIISLGEQFKNRSIASLINFEATSARKKIIDNPCIVTQNNREAEIKSVIVKRGEGEVAENTSGTFGVATTIKVVPYTAELSVKITPRISYLNIEDIINDLKVNLEILLNIEDFNSNSNSNYNKITRSIKTNALIRSGDLLVLGGLHRKNNTGNIAKTPFFSSIPIVGPLFFSQNGTKETSTELIMILRVTVADGELETLYAQEKANYMIDQIDTMVLSKMKDPITRIYFKESEEDFNKNFNEVKRMIFKDKKKEEKNENILPSNNIGNIIKENKIKNLDQKEKGLYACF